MGVRGPKPMSDEERAARGARARRRPGPSVATVRRWIEEATRYERLGRVMIEAAARAKLVTTRNNGPQLHPKFSAGLRLLEHAEKLWARVDRIGGTPRRPPTSAAAPDPEGGDPLDAFSRRRPRG